MKRKLKGVLGVGLTLVMVLSLTVAFMPVAAAADYEENDWGTWGMPAIDSDTDIGPMAVAPDGTLFKSVWDWDPDVWELRIEKSDDNGYSWDATELDDLDPSTRGDQVVEIAIGKNYEDDEILYVATFGGTVYRLEEAGDGDVTAIKDYPDSDVTELYSIDTWYDGDDNWIMAGTDEDVFVLRDAVFEDWGDQDLGNNAYEVAFAPDFDDSELIWAITDDVANDTVGNYVITSTVSPGQWGLEIGEVKLQFDGSDVRAFPWVDLGFPDNYDSDPDTGDTILFAAISSWNSEGGVYLIEGVEDNGDSYAIELFDLAGESFVGTSIVSIAVSGDYPDCVILAAALEEPSVFISDDGGDDWSTADKQPTGWYPFDPTWPGVPDGNFSWTHVYMEADVVWGGDVFDVEESMSFVSTFGFESAVSRSDPNEDGDLVYNQVGEIDTLITGILDLSFHPDFPNTPSLLMITADGGPFTTVSLWLTENGDEEEPDYMRVLCASPSGAPGNHVGGLRLVDWSWDGDVIYIHGDDGDPSVIWKSTDDGQTFGKRRVVKDDVAIKDWEIPLDDTIYAATGAPGFLLTTNSGLSWSATTAGGDMNDIAMSPDFDAEDEEGYILLGGHNGTVMMSQDLGDFEDTGAPAGFDLDVYVAFDADFADEDADGSMLIYAADSAGYDIQVGEVSDIDDVAWDPLEDDENSDTQEIYCAGLQVAEDNALYAVGAIEEVETEAEAVTVAGEIKVKKSGVNTTGWVMNIDEDVTVLDGEFEDGESIIVIDQNLTIGADVTTVSGRVWIKGKASGAEGRFELVDATVSDILYGPFVTDYEVYIINDDLDATVVEETSVVGGGEAAVVRLLLHEGNSEWESAADDDLAVPMGLWLTPGTNVLWTIDSDDAELWNLEDTLSGSPTLANPSDGYQSDREDQMRISWSAMRGIDEDYEYKYTNVDPDYTLDGTTDGTSILLTRLEGSSEYEWKVRAAPGQPWHSRWSDTWTFFTALGEPPWAPTLYAPVNGEDAALLTPAFSWEPANTADNYDFMLADNAAFTSPLAHEKVSSDAFTPAVTLDYDTTYYWKVQAYKGSKAISRWSDVSVFTTLSRALTPTPPVTMTQPAPAPIVLPTPIAAWALWTIVGIGAALVIAVIILVWRTRRPI